MANTSSRRQFLKQTAATGASVAFSGLLSSAARAAQPSPRVIVTRNAAALIQSDSPGGAVRMEQATSMIDQAVAKLMGKSQAMAAWKSLFKPDDVVGIKVNCLFGKGVSTHPEIAHAVANALVRAGLKPENVIIWDRSTGDLLKSGYKMNKDGPGVRVIANDGVWEDEPTKLGSFNGRLTKIVTEQVTAIINIPIMKDHGTAGISGALKNHYGTFDNPGRHHGNHCDPYLADLNAIPAIRDKTRLVIMDALRAQADGGPSLRKAALWDYHTILVSQDPVAIDYLAWKAIDEQRVKTGLKPLAEAGRPPAWIATAASRSLGTNDPDKIQVVKI